MKKQMDNLSDSERLIMAVGTVIILIGAILNLNVPLLVVGFILVLFAKQISNMLPGSNKKNKS